MSALATISIDPLRYANDPRGFDLSIESAEPRQLRLGNNRVYLREAPSTAPNFNLDGETDYSPDQKEVIPPYSEPFVVSRDATDAGVIQLWEGRVLSVNAATQKMSVQLTAKFGQIPEHIADVSLQWVNEQDSDLVAPGAVFYLTLFREVDRGRYKNSQDLRFRRMPTWSKSQVKQIYEDAETILSKAKSRPLAP